MSQLIDLCEDSFVGSKLTTDDILSDFICMLCYGVCIEPVKCNKCETMYCAKCLPREALPGGKPDNKPRSYDNPKYTCYKKCGSNKTVQLSRIEKNILNNLSFKCQHADEHGCEAVVKYEFYKKHLAEECVHKIVFETPKP